MKTHPKAMYARLLPPLNCSRQEGSNLKRKRKKKIALVVAIATLCVGLALINLLFCDIGVTFADNSKDRQEIEEQLGESVDGAIDGLDLKELEEYLKSLGQDERNALKIEDVKALLKTLAAGDAHDFFSQLTGVLGATVGRYFAGFLPSTLTIIIICLLNSMLGGLTDDFLNGSTSEVVRVVCYSAVVVVLMSGVISVISTVRGAVDRLTQFAEAIFPILLTLLSMLGGAASVAAYTPLMAVLCSVILNMIASVILPAFTATIVFSVVGNLSKNVKLDKLTKLIKSSSTWLIGVSFGLFATFCTVQGVTGGVVDKFGFNIAKFALSSYVPILGGYLSDGMDLLSASLVLAKNALGYTGVVVLVATALFPLLKVAIMSLTLRLTAAVAEPIGDGRVASLLTTVANNMGLLVTALAGAAFLFFVLLMLLIGSCNAI